MDEFIEWLTQQGCDVTCTQEDDGSGYACYEVAVPAGSVVTVTVDA